MKYRMSLLLVSVAMVGFSGANPVVEETLRPPNVVLFIADDVSPDFS